jgi:transcriptional regulator with XRE-family HTH domain
MKPKRKVATDHDALASRQPRPRPRRSSLQLNEFINSIKKYKKGRYGTNAQLGKAAKVAPSTVSMILGGTRAPSAKVVVRLAKALCPADRSLDEFTGELLQIAGYAPSAMSLGDVESIADRVARTGQIRVAYVVSEPFVDSERKGFAAELFEWVATLIGAKSSDPVDCELGHLRNVLERREVDVVVSAVLPTFQRRSYMSFSKPFPYLRVPLSAVTRKGTATEDGEELTVKHLLNWRGAAAEGLGKIKILLVRGEVGQEFVTTFLDGIPKDNIEEAKTLDATYLCERLSDPRGPNLLLADMATCAIVQQLGTPKISALRDTSIMQSVQKTLGHREFPVLALYPITFGLPKGDKKWKKTIDRALTHLMSDGFRVLFSLYYRFLERPQPFRDFFIEDDELVASTQLQKMFQGLLNEIRARERREAQSTGTTDSGGSGYGAEKDSQSGQGLAHTEDQTGASTNA